VLKQTAIHLYQLTKNDPLSVSPDRLHDYPAQAARPKASSPGSAKENSLESGVIQAVLEKFSSRSNWAKSQDWNSDQPSLAYHVIQSGKPGAEDRFSLNKFLAAYLDEHSEQGNTDQSGYAIPLYSFDRRSIVGALMVVSSDVSTFTTDKLDNSEKQITSSEFAIIREIARLTEHCLHEVNRTSLLAYNFTKLLDPSKDFPEIVFDIWTTNLTHSRTIYTEEKATEILEKACRFYEEQVITYGADHKGTDKLNAIFDVALGDYSSSIDVRFGAAVDLCLKQVEQERPPRLKDLFHVRAKLEAECMELTQQSARKEGVDIRHLNELVEQAKGIQNIIECLENILFSECPSNGKDCGQEIKPYLKQLRFLCQRDLAIEAYQQVIVDTIHEFLNSPYSEQAQINLKKLIYRLHVHFHVTIAMLSNMELMPYAVLFLILASSAYIGASTFSAAYSPPERLINEQESIQQSSQEHRELLAGIDRIFSNNSQGLEELVAQHIQKVEKRIQEHSPSVLERRLPSYL
jgi:DNA-binding FadR family transcriptional regulator